MAGGKSSSEESYHIEVLQGALTRNLANIFGEVYDEISSAFMEEIPLSDVWTKHPTLNKMLSIVCRTSNRLFVGLPLCRDEEWKMLNIDYTINFFKASFFASMFPRSMQPFVAWCVTPWRRAMDVTRRHLSSILHERLQRYKDGEDETMEEDLLTWLVRAAPKDRGPNPDAWIVSDVLSRVLAVNITAIHTTSQAITFSLINLALHPEYIEPLRKEIEAIIPEYGWSKPAMERMRMLDSFLKESQRISTSSAVTVTRVALKDFTFSDGTVIPAGTLLATAPAALHFDEAYYPNPDEFDGFRSYRQRQEVGEAIKHQMVSPQTSYVTFGYGKHACPGRFFAVNEIKAMMAHVLVNYDIKLDEVPNEKKEFRGGIQSDSKTEIMFRKRRVG